MYVKSKSLHGHPILASTDKLDQDHIIHGLKPMSFTKYYDLLLSAAHQVDQDGYDNSQQCQCKHVMNGCDHIQDGSEALPLLPSTSIMILSNEDIQYTGIKKPVQMKFSDPNVLYAFIQVQKFFLDIMTSYL